MYDINKEVAYCSDLLSTLYDVPQITEIKVSNRMTRTFGMCTTRRNQPNYTKLTFASFVLDDRYPKDKLYNVIVHELLHAIDRNKSGHDGEWLKMAREVSDCLPFGDVTRFVDSECVQYRNEIKPMKIFEVYCPNCNKLTGKRKGHRAPKWYVHPQNYKCNFCGHVGLVAK